MSEQTKKKAGLGVALVVGLCVVWLTTYLFVFTRPMPVREIMANQQTFAQNQAMLIENQKEITENQKLIAETLRQIK